ncbi:MULTISPECIES: hypothetical protein [Pontibacillus]|uniref:Uncharacterized protein n=1 Tax=Pontibacillus chungwhensis TaxID=265426 RepID=A0ABY8V0T5_9BACI|nr:MULTISPECIES: hypothetical protein [Pontibacillus]MCD5324477.1 hypothetical protein [Pontibacillus sp. HN14]WIF99230.1 hypothetical protein QNI29_06100 [Pontibacillus chungwhensis]
MEVEDRKRPKKRWFVIPFIGGGIMLLIALIGVIHRITPQVGVWAPPDTSDLVEIIIYPLIVASFFITSGVLKMILYFKEIKRMEKDKACT